MNRTRIFLAGLAIMAPLAERTSVAGEFGCHAPASGCRVEPECEARQSTKVVFVPVPICRCLKGHWLFSAPPPPNVPILDSVAVQRQAAPIAPNELAFRLVQQRPTNQSAPDNQATLQSADDAETNCKSTGTRVDQLEKQVAETKANVAQLHGDMTKLVKLVEVIADRLPDPAPIPKSK